MRTEVIGEGTKMRTEVIAEEVKTRTEVICRAHENEDRGEGQR
jgi:hypothetical protein